MAMILTLNMTMRDAMTRGFTRETESMREGHARACATDAMYIAPVTTSSVPASCSWFDEEMEIEIDF